MDIVGAANGLNGGNLIPTRTHELHDTPNGQPITFVLRHSKKDLPCMQASITTVTNAVISIGGCIELSD
jgi:hypothetical protein